MNVGDRVWVRYEEQFGTIVALDYEGNGVLVRLDDGDEVIAAAQQLSYRGEVSA